MRWSVAIGVVRGGFGAKDDGAAGPNSGLHGLALRRAAWWLVLVVCFGHEAITVCGGQALVWNWCFQFCRGGVPIVEGFVPYSRVAMGGEAK